MALFGSATEVERRHRERYRPSQQFYFDTVRPIEHADIIVQNDETQQPAWKARRFLIRHLHCQIGHSCYHGSDSARAVMG